MRPSRSASAPAALILPLLLLSGCATTGQPHPKDDPWEPFNRSVYKFNDGFDRHALKPAAKAYVKVTPHWFRTGVGNFFTNLFYPTTILNQLLQGKVKAAGQDSARFLINTTLGWGGVLDVATGANLPAHNEDIGQTLGRWGVPAGPYLQIPLLGPASVRDAPARIIDDFSQPLHWYNPGESRWISLGLNALQTRADLLPLDKTLSETYDPYAFIREAYLQRRQFLVYDGNPPEEPLEDESLEDDGTGADGASGGTTTPDSPPPQ